MVGPTAAARIAAVAAIRVLVVFGAVSFLLGSLLHLSVRVPLGSVVLDEPRIAQAAVVEGLSGIAFAVATVALFGRRPWRWTAAVTAHLLGLAGVLVGTWAIAAGRAPESFLNDSFHRLMLLLLPGGLILLLTPSAQAALGHAAIVRPEGVPTTATHLDQFAVTRPGLVTATQGASGLFAALMLLQSFLAGRGWYVDQRLIAIHGGVGILVVLVAAAQAVLAFLVDTPANGRRRLAVLSTAILLLSALQYLIGFATRDNVDAAAWHIPLGVLLFGLATATTAIVFRLGR